MNQKNNLFRNSFVYIILFVAVVAVVSLFSDGMGSAPSTISYSEFSQQLADSKIKSFEVKSSNAAYTIRGEYREAQTTSSQESSGLSLFDNRTTKATKFETTALTGDVTDAELTKAAKDTNTKMTVTQEGQWTSWFSIGVSLISTLVFVGFFFMMNRMQNGGGQRGPMSFSGKSRGTDQSKQDIKIRFSDVAGAEEEKQELVEVVEFLRDPRKFQELGARIPAGVLLEGPPGTGKTLLAKAVAGEAGVPFYSISGSEFVELYVGVGAGRVRTLFDTAKKNSPAIIFIDEIDAVGRQRGTGMGGGHDEREQTLNQLLVEMDGFTDSDNVIVIAATNRSDVLDPALLRPGRFDRKILVGRPDVKGREAILKVHARNKKLAKDVDLKVVATQTPGFAGAELENLLNEAALVAARRDKKEIDALDIDEAHDRVIAGVAKKDRTISEKERRMVAFHEAGHTIVGMVLNDARVVHKVTIVPRGRAGGYAIMLPKEDQFLLTKQDLFEQIVGLLGGRAAEEMIFDAQTTGASNDFEQATAIARSMVTEYGMIDSLGTVQYEGHHQVFIGRDYGQTKTYSEQVAFEIDNAVRGIMKEAHDKAREILREHEEQLHLIAEKLLELETLDERTIKSLFETGKMPEKFEQEEYPSEHAASYEEVKEALKRRDEHEARNAHAEQHHEVRTSQEPTAEEPDVTSYEEE